MVWSGESSKYTMWKDKLMAYYRMTGELQVDQWVKWAQTQKEPVNDDSIELEFGDNSDRVKRFPTAPQWDLNMHLDRNPFRELEHVTQGKVRGFAIIPDGLAIFIDGAFVIVAGGVGVWVA